MSYEIVEEFQGLAKSIKWKKPRHPYIAFKCKKAEILGSAKRETELEEETGLRAYDTIININVGGVHRQVSKLERIIRNKNLKVIGWGNFPKPESNQAKATKGSSDAPDDWQILEQFCQGQINTMARETKKVQGLTAKVAELEAKLSKGK